MKLSILPLVAVSCLSFAHISAQAAPEMNNADTTMVVERSGKPPFKRTFV